MNFDDRVNFDFVAALTSANTVTLVYFLTHDQIVGVNTVVNVYYFLICVEWLSTTV